MSPIDELDRKIIETIQMNGRLSNLEISEQVGLSHSSCSRRIAKLEKNGVILGYRTLTDRHKLGLSVRAFCGVIRDVDTGWEDLAHTLAEIDGVVSVFAVSGDVDLMLEIVAKDMKHYSQIVLKEVNDTIGVNATRSSFVLEEIKSIY